MQKDRSMPKKACFQKADDRSFYRANARRPKKRSFFGLGTEKDVPSSRAVQAKAGSNGERPAISMICCDEILFPIFRSSFFCHMEAMKVYIGGQSAVGTEDPAFIAEGIHDLMNGGDDFLIGSVYQSTVTVIETA